MYRIETKPYGYRLTFGGFTWADEMNNWLRESKQILLKAPKKFHVFVDMRTLKPLPTEAQAPMHEGQVLYKRYGMVRSVVILENEVTQNQFKRIAKETGIYEWERYLDASKTPDWEKVGMAWIVDAIDPDSKTSPKK